MTFEEYRNYDALGLADLVRQKQISPETLIELAIRRLEEVDPKINAIVHKMYDRAKDMAASLDETAPFAGIPFLIKDLGIQIKGEPMKVGSRALKDFISTMDSEITHRLQQAGFLFLAKTSTPEFGLTPYTEPELTGDTRNPWNLEHSPGGSSGGSAASVASGITPIATASDGGGSIRIPAANCGLFGLKPSRGRITLFPMGSPWSGAVVEGCVSRSVRDSAAFLDAMHGDTFGELHHTRPPQNSYLEEVGKGPGKLRIGFTTQHTLGDGFQLDQECKEAVLHAAKLLESLGHEVEEVPLPFEREDLTQAFVAIIFGETAADLEMTGMIRGKPLSRVEVEPNTWAMGMLGKTIKAKDFALARQKWNEIARRMGVFHQQYDILLTSTLGKVPTKIGQLKNTPAENRFINIINALGRGSLAKVIIPSLINKSFGYLPYTPIQNMTGQPAANIPLYWSASGLPIGTMFTAKMGDEELLFRLAGQLEKASPWFDKIPSI